MKNRPQLIAYADRLAGDLAGLRRLLDGPLSGAFGGVHVLPFFDPIDGADAGFDPIDHTTVDPRLGTWDDIAALAARYDVAADLIANHISVHSAPFRDWRDRGTASTYDGMFLTFDDVFPDGATEADLTAIYRPRPGLCFTPIGVAGTTRLVWTTFTGDQIDLSVEHPESVTYFRAILDRLAAAGVQTVRLDAVGYAVKVAGTSSFMIPETYDFIDRLGAECTAHDIEVLVEIHGHHEMQREVASRVDRVYDFATPPLLLHALTTGDAEPLKGWIASRPANAVVVLDTHDGINLTDVGRDQSDHERAGLLAPDQIAALVETVHARTTGTSRAPTGVAMNNRDLYQINSTFYDALGRSDREYLLCRAVQMFLPGVPQVYYVGLLAGTNDVGLFETTAVGRDINRHRYTTAEIDAALEQPVVHQLLALLRWRNSSSVFDGEFAADLDGDSFALRWAAGDESATLTIDIDARDFHLTLAGPDGSRSLTELTDLAR